MAPAMSASSASHWYWNTALSRPSASAIAVLSGAFQEVLEQHGVESRCRTQRATAPHQHFSKERFTIDLERGTVTCPRR